MQSHLSGEMSGSERNQPAGYREKAGENESGPGPGSGVRERGYTPASGIREENVQMKTFAGG